MADYRRAHVPGGTYFFTIRQAFLTDADVRSVLREAIGRLRLTHPFVIEAWVLLPDHRHALWTSPPGDEDFLPSLARHQANGHAEIVARME